MKKTMLILETSQFQSSLKILNLKALVDLGSSTNILPLSVCQKIGILDMEPTKMVLQLADKSITKPVGIVKGVMVELENFLFPTDFMVMDIDKYDGIPLILGRPFMKMV